MPVPPSFSIVMPTWQRRDLVCEAARAVARIDYAGEFELVVVADGCSDGTAEALRALPLGIPLAVIEQANAGPAAARNAGAAAARGEVLLFLDDDMICRPDILDQHAASLAKGADAVLGHLPLDPGSLPGPLSAGVGEWAERRKQRLLALEAGSGAAAGDWRAEDGFVTGQVSVRRSVFEALGGFDEDLTRENNFGNEDADFGLRLLRGHRVAFNPEAISSQRYVVTAGENVARWFRVGQADVAYARKHGEQGERIFAGNGARKLSVRLLVRPLARTGPLARGFERAAVAAYARLAGRSALADRLAGYLVNKARLVAYWRGVRAAGGRPDSKSALVLCYHALSAMPDDPILASYSVPPATFAGHLDDLARRGHTFVSPDEFLAAMEGRGRLPRRAVLLTFDDCYTDLLEAARGDLAPRGIPAIAFAVTALPSNSNEWDQAAGARRLDLLDAAGLAELAALGVEIGGHSRTHAELPTLDAPGKRREIAGSADDLRAMGLPAPRFFAYPFGANDTGCRATAEAAGYAAAFTVDPGRARDGVDRFAIPRAEIHAHVTGWRFRLRTRFPRLEADARRWKRKLTRA